MKNLKKLLLPGVMLLGVFAVLTSCQTAPQASSSALTETANDTESTICANLVPGRIEQGQFEFRDEEKDGFWTQVRLEFGDETVEAQTQWVRDYLIEAAEGYNAQCGS